MEKGLREVKRIKEKRLDDLIYSEYLINNRIYPRYENIEERELIFNQAKKEILQKIIENINPDKKNKRVTKIIKDEYYKQIAQIDKDLRERSKKEIRKIRNGINNASRYLFCKLKEMEGLISIDDLIEANKLILNTNISNLREKEGTTYTRVRVGKYSPPTKRITYLLKDLVAFLNSNRYYRLIKRNGRIYLQKKEDQLLTIERAFISHIQLILIHPFYDGNGRTARLLQFNILREGDLFPIGTPLTYSKDYFEKLDEIAKREFELKDYYYFIGRLLEEGNIGDSSLFRKNDYSARETVTNRYLKPLVEEESLYELLSDIMIYVASGKILKGVKRYYQKKGYSKHH